MSTPGPPLGDPPPVNPPSAYPHPDSAGWNQHPGWNQQPAWEQQPSWEQHPGWQYPPVPYPPAPTKRANGKAFVIAAAVGAIVWVAADVFITARSDQNPAFVAGQSFGIALIPAFVVAIIAWSSRSHWPLWRYPVFIAPAAVVLTLLGVVVSNGIATSSGVTHQRRTMTIPAVVGTWTRDDSPAAKAKLQPAKDDLQGRLGADAKNIDVALYRRGDERVLLMVVTTRPASRMDNDTARSPRQSVADVLAGAGVDQPSVADAGPLGGALGCGPSAKNKQLYMCSWAELGMVGTMVFANTTTAVEAAQTTREFRSRTEH